MTKLEDKKLFHKLSTVIFALYLWLLVWVISLKWNQKITITDTYYIFGAMTWPEKLEFAKQGFLALFTANKWAQIFLDVRQELLNVVVFVPFGIYLGYFLREHKLLWTLLIGFLTSFVLEALQLISHIGCFAPIDMATNTLGALIGFAIYKLFYKDTLKRTKALNIASIVAMCVVVPVALYALIKTATMLDFYLAILLRTY